MAGWSMAGSNRGIPRALIINEQMMADIQSIPKAPLGSVNSGSLLLNLCSLFFFIVFVFFFFFKGITQSAKEDIFLGRWAKAEGLARQRSHQKGCSACRYGERHQPRAGPLESVCMRVCACTCACVCMCVCFTGYLDLLLTPSATIPSPDSGIPILTCELTPSFLL